MAIRTAQKEQERPSLIIVDSHDARSRSTGVGIEFVDLPLPEQKTPIRFTFLWVDENRWEGKDYKVELQARADQRVRGAAYGRNTRTACCRHRCTRV